jgi:hypothetical protein
VLNIAMGRASAEAAKDRRAEARLRAAAREFRALPEARLGGVLAQHARGALIDVAHEMTAEVRSRISEYNGKPSGRREKLIALAATAAMEQFLDILEGKSMSTARTQELFRKMGYGSAFEGHSADALHGAMQIAMLLAWRRLREVAVSSNIPGVLLVRLIDLMLAYTEALCEQVTLGYASASRALDRDPDHARTRLAQALLAGSSTLSLSEESIKAEWPLPAHYVVAVVQWPESDAMPLARAANHPLLSLTERGVTFVIAPADAASPLASSLADDDAVLRSAISPVVDVTGVPDAARWAERALTLASQGVLADARVIACEDHLATLWLHAEPRLRDELVQSELEPLLAQPSNSRDVLSQTMLTWLTMRHSASALSKELDVHPQTVRYRLKRITEMFGPSVDDPDKSFLLTMLLRASLPRWRAGDPSDVERYWARKTR